MPVENPEHVPTVSILYVRYQDEGVLVHTLGITRLDSDSRGKGKLLYYVLHFYAR